MVSCYTYAQGTTASFAFPRGSSNAVVVVVRFVVGVEFGSPVGGLPPRRARALLKVVVRVRAAVERIRVRRPRRRVRVLPVRPRLRGRPLRLLRGVREDPLRLADELEELARHLRARGGDARADAASPSLVRVMRQRELPVRFLDARIRRRRGRVHAEELAPVHRAAVLRPRADGF
eukprot:31176-Pelagococcus_subviridis.AAC.66